MTSTHSDNDFINRLTSVTEASITNPQFGVSMLAKEMGMSRSNLHRKVNSELKISVSQFINHVRLKKAKNILRHTSNTVSEVAYEVGFNNVSYFIKCFHNYYGYSPGQVGDREETQELSNSAKGRKHLRKIYIAAIAVALIGVMLIMVFKPLPFQQKKLENTFAVLPPEIWETVDTIQIFGIVQSVRTNLGKIGAIEKVTPRLSVQQYKNTTDPAPKIARELDVNYLVQPRVWVNNDDVILSINLMEGPDDEDLDTFDYPVDTNSVTTVHLDIVRDISKKLDIRITPAEQGRIDKPIASNRKALNYYYEGMDYLERLNKIEANRGKAISCFEMAIKHDSECAAAYAQLAITYFQLDYHWSDESTPSHEILYGKEINYYADKAIHYDPHLDLSLIAKALYYRNEKEYETAIIYLKRALDYNQNSYLAIYQLSTLYLLTENREKYIEYALRIINDGIPVLNINKELIIEKIYVNLSRQYRFAGCIDEALLCIDKAIQINRDYTRAYCVKSHIILDQKGYDYNHAISILEQTIKRDSTNPCAIVRLAHAYYMLQNYEKANAFYNKWMKLMEYNTRDLSGYPSGRLAYIYKKLGESEKAQVLINNYLAFSESRISSYRNLQLTGFYSFMEDTAKALKHLKISSKYDYAYFKIRQLKDEPIYENIRKHPQFQEIHSKMERRCTERQDSIRAVFEKKGLLDLNL